MAGAEGTSSIKNRKRAAFRQWAGRRLAFGSGELLAPELAALRQCMPRRILFLDAPDPVLRRRKEGDAARDRGFFEHSLTALLPLKRAWFAAKDNVDFLDTASLTPDEVGAAVLDWTVRQRRA